MRNIARNCRNSGPPPQAQDALREDGGNLGDSLFRGHVGGVGGIVDEGHRRSFVRGDARNDLRFAARSGAWQLDAEDRHAADPHIPH